RGRELLQRYLTEQGFSIKTVADSTEMDSVLAQEHIDLLVLDLMLPGEDGLAICRRLRSSGSVMPIIMLTARGDEVDRIIGLEMGADDYLPKPFNPRELLARINAIIKRSKGHSPRRIDVLGLSLDEDNKTVRQNNVLHNLTPIEYMLLRLFLLNPNKLLTKSRLLESLYEVDSDPDSNVLEVYISRLRQKIGKHRIITRRNQGYLFKDDT
ncbi:MAG: two-component response regulator, partial [Pseudomonadota bacterium]